MLLLHSGRENVDKEKYIYESIEGEAIVIVPNQYTFVAEEQALKYTGRTCLFDIEILSMNRLGLRVLGEQGLEGSPMLSRTGRSMLLSRIIRNNKDAFSFFSKSAGRASFIELLADFISEFKQQNCTVEELMRLTQNNDVDPLLSDKLTELEGVIREYEAQLEGHFTDSEDFQARYIEQIKNSRWLRNKTIWIYGYDTVTPKFMSAVIELAKVAASVNMILNSSDYDLDIRLKKQLEKRALLEGLSTQNCIISDRYALAKSDTIRRIESSLLRDDAVVDPGFAPRDLTVVECANEYYEAESAAAYVKKLLRDYNYRMKDITIICNDKEVMQPIVQRVFEEYGMDIFIDSTRRITDCAPVCFVAALMALTRFPYSTENIFTLLKTDISGFDRESVEKLEIYASKYRIRHSMWTKPFLYGREEYGDEEFDKLEATRAALVCKLEVLDALARDAGTVSDWTRNFRDYLETEWQLADRLDQFLKLCEELGELDEALKIKGSMTETIEVMDQLDQIMGDDPFDRDEIMQILEAGLTSMNIGIIPPSLDGISMGAMIRTRPRPAKAVLILGCNEGKVPLQPSSDGLFSVDELSYFKDNDLSLGALDEIKMLEENVAVYRMLSKASEKLYVSYSLTDASGTSLTPSVIVEELSELFPKLKIHKDVVSMGFGRNLVVDSREAMRHLINHLKDKNTDKMDNLSAALIAYYEEHEPELLKSMLDAACDENEAGSLGHDLAKKLWARNDEFVMSASALQNYKECPFRFFVDRGLRPYEDRAFASDARSIGDIYHECMMIVGRKLRDGDTRSVETLVDEALSSITSNYREGLFKSSGNEDYRLARIREIVAAAAKAMAKQFESGTIVNAEFEVDFGKGKTFAPIELEVDGEKLRIEGKIDRADILTGDKARIIDYKTGSDTLDLDKMRNGYKMQLMIYLMSVTTSQYEPAGMFYFNISQKQQSADSLSVNKLLELDAKELADEFKLKGQYINEGNNLELMPAEILYERTPKGMSREDFDAVQADVRDRLIEQSHSIINGEIPVSPLKDSSNNLSCRYCKYKAICRYDASSYRGNKAREL